MLSIIYTNKNKFNQIFREFMQSASFTVRQINSPF